MRLLQNGNVGNGDLTSITDLYCDQEAMYFWLLYCSQCFKN